MSADQMTLLPFKIGPAVYSQLLLPWSFLIGFSVTSISHLQSILHNSARVTFLKCPFDLPLPKPPLAFQWSVETKSGCFARGLQKPFFALALACHAIAMSQCIIYQYSAHFNLLIVFPEPGLFPLSIYLWSACSSFNVHYKPSLTPFRGHDHLLFRRTVPQLPCW